MALQNVVSQQTKNKYSQKKKNSSANIWHSENLYSKNH